MATERAGWEPQRLKVLREEHGLTLEGVGEALRQAAAEHGVSSPAANFQTIWGHESGSIYPGPLYRRIYCLLYNTTEADLGFRRALPNEPGPKRPDPATRTVPAVAELVRAGARAEQLLGRFRAASQEQRPGHPCLVLVGGYAGSGKSELSGSLCRETGWAMLDKDTLTRPLVENLLSSLGLDPHDRHSSGYLTVVRPREYECLMDSACENISRGISTVAAAPLVTEFSDPEWLRQTSRMCERVGGLLMPVWVRCDVESMREYIQLRAAARDCWKLDNWAEYAATLDDDFTPAGPHFVIDNRHGAAVEYCDVFRGQQTALAAR